MDTGEIEQLFEEYNDLFLKFEWNESLPSKRPDLCAFMLLDKLVPNTRDMIAGAEHDEIYLDISLDDLIEAKATKEDIEFLVRCGVRNGEYGLCMFA